MSRFGPPPESSDDRELYHVVRELPPHLRGWELPPGWAWGSEGVVGQHRHYQEIVDALGRSLSLVSVADPAHHGWLEREARRLAHRNHPAIPTTYHYWSALPGVKRGPGYLRRWIAGETIGARIRRNGPDDVPAMLRILRELGSALSYLHDSGSTHGSVGLENAWIAPMGRIWILGWQWAMARAEIPEGLRPDYRFMPVPPEWHEGEWAPTHQSDQWQLAAVAFAVLTGEYPPDDELPPVRLLRPDCPASVATLLERALSTEPADRFPSVASLVRAVDRAAPGRSTVLVSPEERVSGGMLPYEESDESRLRWATGDDYEVLAALGSGSFGSVWRVRDLALGREVALKLLHPHVASDERAVTRFRREAKLAAQLSHPAIVPIFDWDSRGEVSWYTMELAEGGSVADLVARRGPRTLLEVAPQIDAILGGLSAAHAIGIIHRDLKPENVLIDRYGRWRVADFGIANAPGETLAGASGTPAFAPPEQLLGEAQDVAADCFSVAAIAVFALTGKPPFGSDAAQSIVSRQLRGDLDLGAHPAPIARWLETALSAESQQRFADAATMQAAWREAVEEVLAEDPYTPWWRRWLPELRNAEV